MQMASVGTVPSVPAEYALVHMTALWRMLCQLLESMTCLEGPKAQACLHSSLPLSTEAQCLRLHHLSRHNCTPFHQTG